MVDSDDIDDRRKDERRPIELKVEYQRLNTFFSDYTKNISKGGTFIKTDKPLGIGTEFVFKLYVPTLEDPIQIRGQVQWVVGEEDIARGNPRSNEPGMGILFVFHDPEEQHGIERTVEKLMVDSLGQLLYSRLMEHSRRGEKPPEEG